MGRALLGVALALAAACAHHHGSHASLHASPRASPFDGRYDTDELAPATKVLLVAGGDDVANFAEEIVDQRRMWKAAGLHDDEIACFWAQPTDRAWSRDRKQYRRLAAAVADCRPASAARVLAEIAELGRRNVPWLYVYVSTHGVQVLAAEGSGWYLDADERRFLAQHALSLDADPKLRLQHVGNILVARRGGARDDVLVMTPSTLRGALEVVPPNVPKIVVLQGCFSGGFVDEPVSLRGLPHTTVLTAAASDRPSFGCGSGTRTTFWGGALLRELRKRVHRGTTPPSLDWHAIHDAVTKRVTHLERALGQKPSRPQFYSTDSHR